MRIVKDVKKMLNPIYDVAGNVVPLNECAVNAGEHSLGIRRSTINYKLQQKIQASGMKIFSLDDVRRDNKYHT